jgi:bacterioferritin
MPVPVGDIMNKGYEILARVKAAAVVQAPGAPPDDGAEDNSELIAMMNHILADEMAAIIQYMNHSEFCGIWGYSKLDASAKARAIAEMKHAEALIKRIRFIGGNPQLQPGPIFVGQSVQEMLDNDTKAELGAIQSYNAAVEAAYRTGDSASRNLLEQNLNDEEEHLEYLKAQLAQIQQYGYQNYLQAQV